MLLKSKVSNWFRPSTTERSPAGRSAALSSQPRKPPRTTAANVNAFVSIVSFTRFVPAIQISFLRDDAALSASVHDVKASVQLVPSFLPTAPGRTWMTFAGPFLPYHGGSVPETTALVTADSPVCPAPVAEIFTKIVLPGT